MKSYKEITQKEVYSIMTNKYPRKALPFMTQNDVPNNWLKLHGYTMHRSNK